MLHYGYSTKRQVVYRYISWLNRGKIIYVANPFYVVLLNSFNKLSYQMFCKEEEELHSLDSYGAFFLIDPSA